MNAPLPPLSLPLPLLERLFDALPDVVFFAKDADGRYTHANQTLVERLRLPERRSLLGRRANEVFPQPLGQRYAAQDEQVLRQGVDITDQLELHLYPNRAPGWCLTHKLCWREQGRVVGLAGISRDLAGAQRSHAGSADTLSKLAQVVARIQREFDQPITVAGLAADAAVSVAQLERLFAQVYHLSPRQWIARTRLDAALALLGEGEASVAAIAHACGYADHSAFTRQFRRTIGLSPTAYRAMKR